MVGSITIFMFKVYLNNRKLKHSPIAEMSKENVSVFGQPFPKNSGIGKLGDKEADPDAHLFRFL